MELHENYIDTDHTQHRTTTAYSTPNIDSKRNVEVAGNATIDPDKSLDVIRFDSFSAKSDNVRTPSKWTAMPTVSLSLDDTVVYQLDKTLNGDNDDGNVNPDSIPRLPSASSLNMLRSVQSRASSVQPQLKQTISTTVTTNPTLVSAFETSNEAILQHSSGRDLVETLAQSIYSYAPSTATASRRTSFLSALKDGRPVFSGEIPDIFEPDIDCLSPPKSAELQSFDKNYFILTAAGKPVYVMHGEDKEVTSFTAVINTVVSYFQMNEHSNVKSIRLPTKHISFTFLNKPPILLMAYSRRGEVTSQILGQLDLLYSYLISSINERQLHRLFNNRSNFDLRNYLEPTDFRNLNKLCAFLCHGFSPEFTFNCVQSFVMRKSIRKQLHDTIIDELIKEEKYIPRGTLLYGLLVSRNSQNKNKLCAVVRPRGHTLHTTDLQLLFELISRQFENMNGNQELWMPICLPKFNSNGFLYSYMKFLAPESDTGDSDSIKPNNDIRHTPNDLHHNDNNNSNSPAVAAAVRTENSKNDTILVLISAQKDAFFRLKLFGDRLWNRICKEGLNRYLYEDYLRVRLSDIPAPLVHHFVYKSRKHVQYIMPELDYNLDYESEREMRQRKIANYERKLKFYYDSLHESAIRSNVVYKNNTLLHIIHWQENADEGISLEANASGTPGHDSDCSEPELQLEKINVMGVVWGTAQFELYLLCNNNVDNKRVVLKSARKIVSWCKKNESRLFIRDGAVF